MGKKLATLAALVSLGLASCSNSQADNRCVKPEEKSLGELYLSTDYDSEKRPAILPRFNKLPITIVTTPEISRYLVGELGIRGLTYDLGRFSVTHNSNSTFMGKYSDITTLYGRVRGKEVSFIDQERDGIVDYLSLGDYNSPENLTELNTPENMQLQRRVSHDKDTILKAIL